jgi:hypothetical protein
MGNQSFVRRFMQTRVGGLLGLWSTLLLAGALATGCGPSLVAMGAEIAASGLRDGTSSAARGGTPQPAAAAAVGAGAALMVTGYKLTPPDQRQPPTQQATLWPITPPVAPNAPVPPAQRLP